MNQYYYSIMAEPRRCQGWVWRIYRMILGHDLMTSTKLCVACENLGPYIFMGSNSPDTILYIENQEWIHLISRTPIGTDVNQIEVFLSKNTWFNRLWFKLLSEEAHALSQNKVFIE